MPDRITVRKHLPVHPDTITDAEGAEIPSELAGQVDLEQLAKDLGNDTVWVGDGSQWALPWEEGTGTFAIAEGLTVNTDDRADMARALNFVIRWALPIYPNANQIRTALKGKNLATDEPKRQPSHADVLLAVANGKDYQP